MKEKKKKDLKEIKISFATRLLFWLFPNFTAKRLAKRSIENKIAFDKLHEVFAKTKRIDLFKTAGNERGFIFVLDQCTALFFYQNGDHFEYDGWETGKYGIGDITILDNSSSKKDPYELEE
ncbi:MAG: hypothetical protein ABIG60_00615 [Patescibacteria group bacterium]